MLNEFIKLFACRVCKYQKEANKDKPCPYSLGQYCPFIEQATAETLKSIESDRILVKRGEIA